MKNALKKHVQIAVWCWEKWSKMRDQKGRFVKGCKPGPGRPRKKAVKLEDAPLWSYELLHQAWLAFKTTNAYSQKDLLKCKCGNEDAARFDYQLDVKGAKLRARCKVCGSWNDFREQHAMYIAPLMTNLTREERAQIAIQRKAH
jgi:hypothetical protein